MITADAKEDYAAREYWADRFSSGFDLTKVRYLGFSESYIKLLYRAKIIVLKKFSAANEIEIKNKTVCDVGCGTGYYVNFYSNEGVKHITGIDITQTSINYLKSKYPKYDFVRGDISSQQILFSTKNKFDVVNVFDVLYHVVNDTKFEQAIQNICELTKHNGLIFFTDATKSDVRTAQHVKFRSQQTYRTSFRSSGAQLIGVLPLHFLLNRRLFGQIGATIYLDNLLAPLYYRIDELFISRKRSNMKLGIAKKLWELIGIDTFSYFCVMLMSISLLS
jgi:2-polyprenyl-3-methyl-5-hydroxy-6-metoxy-1,4-benzoquinol methylase